MFSLFPNCLAENITYTNVSQVFRFQRQFPKTYLGANISTTILFCK